MGAAVGFSNAELQQRWRERQKAKVEALEARIRELEALLGAAWLKAAPPAALVGAAVLKAEPPPVALLGVAWLIAGLETELLKWKKLAKERQRRLTAIENASSRRGVFMSKRLVRHIRASLHHDRATDPKKRQLRKELSKEFNSLTIVSDD
jgi:hypothetical protein